MRQIRLLFISSATPREAYLGAGEELTRLVPEAAGNDEHTTGGRLEAEAICCKVDPGLP